MKIRVGVAHGAIKNAGDYLIYKRGLNLLKETLGDITEFVEIKRWIPFDDKNLHLDALIILGGPIVSRKLHPQAKNIYNYINTHQPNLPIIAFGIGISGERFKSPKEYFLDNSSLEFWKKVYQSSKLISVRDKITQEIFEAYGITPYLTGCPALYSNLSLKLEHEFKQNSNKYCANNILITLPNISFFSITFPYISLYSLYLTLLSLIFILFSRFLFPDKKLHLLLQHGAYNFSHKLLSLMAKILGFKIINGAYKSIDEVLDVEKIDLHIGCRLHTHILFLSEGKPSYLFNLDNRTNAFLTMFNTPSQNFSINGIINLIYQVKTDLENNTIYEKFKPCYTLIKNEYTQKMRLFLHKLRKYLISLSSNNPSRKNSTKRFLT